MRKRVFDIIQIGNREDVPSTAFDIFIVIAILLSISTTFLQTFDSLDPIDPVLGLIELITILIFIVEYALRLWTADYLYPEKENKGEAIGSFMISFYGIIDLLTIVSYFVPFMFSFGVVALRMLRVVRIFRLFNLGTNYDAFNVIIDVLKNKWDQILSSICMILVLMLAASMCMYSLEHEAQPDVFVNAFSGFWWSVSTILTVGYGDMYPITLAGQIMAIIIAFLGVGLVAIPTGIISAGFVEYYSKFKAGAFAEHEADFICVDIDEDVMLTDLPILKGLYPAAVFRGDDILTIYEKLQLKAGDVLMLASKSATGIKAHIRVVELKSGHQWINTAIKNLDISRQIFIVMVKRSGRQFEPTGELVLLENDTVVVLDRRNFG